MKMASVLTGILMVIGMSGNRVSGQTLPVDPVLLKGQLGNGISYYIKNNATPQGIVELRLIVNVGSLSESESEQGLAHFVEHMCFNGTKNFPGNQAISYLEANGLRFGKQFNAYTSFQETVYQLTLPSSDKLLNDGFQILEDWAHQVSFDTGEIEKERGVIIQELRTGLGPEERLRNQYFPAIFRGALYQYRMPIGKIEVLESFHPDVIRNFYKKWYRPDLMTVVVVGDIEPDKALGLVNKYFGNIASTSSKSAPVEGLVTDNLLPTYTICTDPETAKEYGRIYFLRDTVNIRNQSDLKESITENIVKEMISRRFKKLNQQLSSPFMFTMIGIGELVRPKDAFTYTCEVKQGMLAKGIETLLVENQRLVLHGFIQPELELEKKLLIDKYKQVDAEKVESKEIVNSLVASSLRAMPIIDPAIMTSLSIDLISSITLDDVNRSMRGWLTRLPIIVGSLPDSQVNPGISIDALQAMHHKVLATDPGKYEQLDQNNILELEVNDGGKVIDEKHIAKYGITEWTLNNGAKVILKPTPFKNNEILFRATSKGGLSMYTDKDFVTASLSFKVAFMSGIAGLSFTEMKDMNKLSGIDLAPVMSEYNESLNGSCKPGSVEALLKLNYYYFNKLQVDSISAVKFISRYINQGQSLRNGPDYKFNDTISSILYGDNPRHSSLIDTSRLKEFDVKRANQIISERFANPSDFTFIFIGSFDPDSIRPLVEKYLGAIKGSGSQDIIPNEKYITATSSSDVTLKAGTAQKSLVQITYFGDLNWTRTDRSTAKLLTEVLKINLRKALREDKSGVYGVQVNMETGSVPESHYMLNVIFECSTTMVDTLINEVDRQIKIISMNGPTTEALDKVKNLLTTEYEQTVKTNKYWQEELVSIYCFDKNIDTEIGDYIPSIMKVNAEQVLIMAASKLLDNKKITVKRYPIDFHL